MSATWEVCLTNIEVLAIEWWNLKETIAKFSLENQSWGACLSSLEIFFSLQTKPKLVPQPNGCYIYILIKITVKKCNVNINLHDKPISRQSKCKHKSNYSRFDNRRKSFIIIKFFNLYISFANKIHLIALNFTIFQ